MIALEVPDAEAAYAERWHAARAAPSSRWWTTDEYGQVKRAAIYTYGETLHSFVERDDYAGVFLPGYRADRGRYASAEARGVGLAAIDHVVGNVELGKMNEWVKFYEDVLGFKQIIHFTDEAISTEYSALMSKVMEGGHGKIKFPINEPAVGQARSRRFDEYLDYYGGPGVQHVAMITGDIIETVRHLQGAGRRVPQGHAQLLRRTGRRVSARSTSRLTNWRSSASWWTATTTAICCRSSPATCRIARRCSSRSSSARARAASARATSRRCSRPSSASRRLRGNL